MRVEPFRLALGKGAVRDKKSGREDYNKENQFYVSVIIWHGPHPSIEQ
jgi:hypothetical protein